MNQRSGKTMRSLVVGLAAAAIAAPVAQAGFQARSERSLVVRPASSFYSSPAYYAELVRWGAMTKASAAAAVRHADERPAASFYSSQAYHALMVRSAAMNAFYSKHPSTSVGRSTIPDAFARELTKARSAAAVVRHADDRAGVRGPGITETPQVVTASGDGFDWGDASVGAGVALGALIVLTGGVALSRRNRTAPLAV